MPDVVASERKTDRRTIGTILLVGFALAALGASAATTLQVWDVDVAERISRLAEGSSTAWIWGNTLLGIGIVLAASGMHAFASVLGTALARVGGALWLIAAAVSAIAFIIQGTGGAEMATLLSETSEIPGGFLVLESVQESLLILFGALASLGGIAIGIASMKAPWMAKMWGTAIAIAGVVGLGVLALNIPIVALIGVVVAASGLLSPGSPGQRSE